MNIFGTELELDVFDADQIELYEGELLKISKIAGDKKQYKGLSNADSIRLQCKLIDDFFDSIFGVGCSAELFKGKANIKTHLDAFAQVVEEISRASDELKQQTKSLMTLQQTQQDANIKRFAPLSE